MSVFGLSSRCLRCLEAPSPVLAREHGHEIAADLRANDMPRCSAAHSQVCKWWVVKSIRSTDPQRTNDRSGRPPRGKTQRGCRNLTRFPGCWSRDHHAIRSAVLRRYAQSSAPTRRRIGFQGLGRGVNVPSRAVPATSRWEGRRVGPGGTVRPRSASRSRASFDPAIR